MNAVVNILRLRIEICRSILKNKHLCSQSVVNMKQATFSMACFWAPDCLFGVVKGVLKTRVGYTGGTLANPVYRILGDHTESILIDFDPNIVSYDELLDIFWNNHNPHAIMSRQYTSIIFYHDDEQKELAEKSYKKQQILRNHREMITQVLPAVKFYDAEDYHQKYRLRKHPFLCESLGLRSGEDFKNSFVAARLNGYVVGQGGINQFNEEVATLGLSSEVADYVRTLLKEHEGEGLTC